MNNVANSISSIRQGTNGVGTNGVNASFMFFDRGTFWVLPLACFYLPRSARLYLFSQAVKILYFCSGPISADPIWSATKARARAGEHAGVHAHAHSHAISLANAPASAGRRGRQRRVVFVCMLLYVWYCLYVFVQFCLPRVTTQNNYPGNFLFSGSPLGGGRRLLEAAVLFSPAAPMDWNHRESFTPELLPRNSK